jgi:hypothetical protein
MRVRLRPVRHRKDEKQRERAQQDVAEPLVECHALHGARRRVKSA